MDIEDKAAGDIGSIRRHEFLGGSEELGLQANGF
jgi:hypothetical protein